jgi:hypothetical protein
LLPNLQRCLTSINSTNRVLSLAQELRTCPYDSHNTSHEQMLEQLWCVA